MDYGYSRCSTNEGKQDINRQVRGLRAAGAQEIFMEYEHGDAKVKSQQAQMFAAAQAGDTIIVLEVSRLARSTQQLCEIIDLVREKRLRLVIVGSMTLDCREGPSDPMITARFYKRDNAEERLRECFRRCVGVCRSAFPLPWRSPFQSAHGF